MLSLRGGIGVGSLDTAGDAPIPPATPGRFFMEGLILPERTKAGRNER